MDNFPQHVSSYLKTIFRWTKYPFYTGFSTEINDDKSLTYLVDNYFPGNKNTFSGRNNKKLDGTKISTKDKSLDHLEEFGFISQTKRRDYQLDEYGYVWKILKNLSDELAGKTNFNLDIPNSIVLSMALIKFHGDCVLPILQIMYQKEEIWDKDQYFEYFEYRMLVSLIKKELRSNKLKQFHRRTNIYNVEQEKIKQEMIDWGFCSMNEKLEEPSKLYEPEYSQDMEYRSDGNHVTKDVPFNFSKEAHFGKLSMIYNYTFDDETFDLQQALRNSSILNDRRNIRKKSNMIRKSRLVYMERTFSYLRSLGVIEGDTKSYKNYKLTKKGEALFELIDGLGYGVYTDLPSSISEINDVYGIKKDDLDFYENTLSDSHNYNPMSNQVLQVISEYVFRNNENILNGNSSKVKIFVEEGKLEITDENSNKNHVVKNATLVESYLENLLRIIINLSNRYDKQLSFSVISNTLWCISASTGIWFSSQLSPGEGGDVDIYDEKKQYDWIINFVKNKKNIFGLRMATFGNRYWALGISNFEPIKKLVDELTTNLNQIYKLK